ncbi:2Fe-2S iron-sulfur cluster-binding protein [Neobacillus drentensis]|uniref:2Fe-2S iron-sulfur cluster-binding protein n=1 Tax=Neobacillus drentensis TaxID=220684 RepID=UPI0008250EC2|nr:2Fe-2S iron-sulfur cluster-binding protein [Neobacillus drentensis]
MSEISIYVNRTNHSENRQLPQTTEKYTLPLSLGDSTVLEALQTIQEEIDDDLAIRYGCRFKQCGLCAVTVNGNPRMGCMTKVKEGMVIGPLDQIPVQKDLVVDRKFITETIKQKKLFPQLLNHSKNPLTSKEFDILNKCTDCQSCLSGCPEYSYKEMDSFAGPMFFVKLAQLQNHPQNEHNYSGKAKELGMEKCESCPGCPCPYGIPIKKLAINPFLNELKTT